MEDAEIDRLGDEVAVAVCLQLSDQVSLTHLVVLEDDNFESYLAHVYPFDCGGVLLFHVDLIVHCEASVVLAKSL